MARIPLSQNQFATIDDEDLPRVQNFKWFYKPNRDGTQGCAIRHIRVGPNRYTTEYLSRRIVGEVPPGMQVVHLDYDFLNCTKANLAVMDRVDAQRRKRVRKDSVSGVKGVRQVGKNWVATLWREGKPFPVGVYRTKEQARSAFEDAVQRWDIMEGRIVA